MIKYLKTYPDKCIGCRACEDACSEMFFKVKDTEKTAIKITDSDGKCDILVCNQCGACINLCPAGAISKSPAGTITIDKKSCSGCLICVAECPCSAMMYHSYEPYPFKCIACGVCVKQCPAGAIEICSGDVPIATK